MNISIQLAVVALAACLCLTEASAGSKLARYKQQRPTRGFKNVEMMTARGFGKRDKPPTRTELYGADNFWEALESTEKEGLDGSDGTPLDSIPLEWFINEMLTNPELARATVIKFIDVNQDGLLSPEELLRTV